MDLVEQTWQEIGKRIRPLAHWIFLRTDPIEKKTAAGIILTDKMTDFYEGMPHQKVFTGTVCSVGSEVKGVQVGERIAFQRLFFARYDRMQDGTYFGWIREENLLGHAAD